jgi:LmbE family N-acetylglucosaminyl deacetylase
MWTSLPNTLPDQRGNIDAITAMGPLGITRHVDHIATHHATMRAVERSGREPLVFTWP